MLTSMQISDHLPLAHLNIVKQCDRGVLGPVAGGHFHLHIEVSEGGLQVPPDLETNIADIKLLGNQVFRSCKASLIINYGDP